MTRRRDASSPRRTTFCSCDWQCLCWGVSRVPCFFCSTSQGRGRPFVVRRPLLCSSLLFSSPRRCHHLMIDRPDPLFNLCGKHCDNVNLCDNPCDNHCDNLGRVVTTLVGSVMTLIPSCMCARRYFLVLLGVAGRVADGTGFVRRTGKPDVIVLLKLNQCPRIPNSRITYMFQLHLLLLDFDQYAVPLLVLINSRLPAKLRGVFITIKCVRTATRHWWVISVHLS